MSDTVVLPRDSNQARGIGDFAVEFMRSGEPGGDVLDRTSLFHTDAVLCGLSALALRTNAPTILRREALEYPAEAGASVFGSTARVQPEKAVVANSSAVREWDSNGTNFGFNPGRGHVAGEFGHNDFYSVAMAACQANGLNGGTALRGMVLLDEIRGRLAEVFSLKTYKIDHVLHGAIASAATYVAISGRSSAEIESAIGLVVAHYVPWRAIRAGKQLSDSKGASAALAAETAVLAGRRAMAGFVGPADIFRNPESLFRQFEPTKGDSPFDLVLTKSGSDFAIMGMHFKLGLYEHQSAGGLHGLYSLLARYPALRAPGSVGRILVTAYEPAYGIIGDPAKRDPHTRQSADHSMVYILATALRRAWEMAGELPSGATPEDLWAMLMPMPSDYSNEAIHHPVTRDLISKMEFEHGGPEYDAKYPDGIPTSVTIVGRGGQSYESGLIMYPPGHARNQTADLSYLLGRKFRKLAEIALPEHSDPDAVIRQLSSFPSLTAEELLSVYDIPIAVRPPLD